MKIFRPLNQLKVEEESKNVMFMEENVDYIVPDAFLSFVGPQYASLIDDFKPTNFYNGEDLNGKKLFCFRSGGIGDLLFITTALRKLKQNYPDAELELCCNSAFIPLLEPADKSFKLSSMPVMKSVVESADFVLHFQGMIEENPKAEEINAYDLVAELFHIKNMTDEEKIPKVNVRSDSFEKAKTIINLKFPDGDIPKRHIAVQLHASVPKRTIPVDIITGLVMRMPVNYVYWFFGAPHQVESIDLFIRSIADFVPNPSCLVNGSRLLPGLEDMAAAISLMDFVVGPDSSMLHIAAGLGKSLIGLFGAFPSDLRLRYYKNAIGIDSMSNCEFARGKYKCCFEHGNGSCALAIKTSNYYSPCMNLLNTNSVIEAIKTLGFPTGS